MDIATIAGVFLGFGLVLWSMSSGAGIGAFVDIPSIAIVIGGTLGATLMSFPLAHVIGVIKVLKKCLMYPLPTAQAEIERMADFAYVARREGLLALEEKIKELDDQFLIKGVRLVVDGFPAQTVRDILGIELFGMQARHQRGKKVVDQMGALAPSFGMIGTLVGLIAMLKSLDDPSNIGGGMAVALLTTFYGAVISNMVFLPLGVKLDARQKEETLMKEIMIEGIAAIQAGDKPQMIKEKLKSYMPPSDRAGLDTAKKK